MCSRTEFIYNVKTVYHLHNGVNSLMPFLLRACVYTHTYHSGVPQVQSVPAEALREAVRLLAYAVFIGFNAAMRCHRLSCKRKLIHETPTLLGSLFILGITEAGLNLVPSLGTGCVSQNW